MSENNSDDMPRTERLVDGLIWIDERTPAIPRLGLGARWSGATMVALGAVGGSVLWSDPLLGAMLSYLYVFSIVMITGGDRRV